MEWVQHPYTRGREPTHGKACLRTTSSRIPSLPSFGILYLSVHRAAALIVRDIYEWNRPPLTLSWLEHPATQESLQKLQEDLTRKIRIHLVKAIEKGRLPSVNQTNTYREFVEYGDQSNASSAYIFYGDLVNWLVNNGYEDSRFLAVSPLWRSTSRS